MLCVKIEVFGVIVYIGKNMFEIVDGDEGMYWMVFVDGMYFDIDMIVFLVGIWFCDELVCVCGFDIGLCGGVVIDDVCCMSDVDIYVIGECVVWNGIVYGFVVFGYDMVCVVVK